MNMDNLGYRYSRAELETLRLILRLDVPVGMDFVKIDRETYDRCVDSLCIAGLMIDAGETAMIEPVTMLMMQQAARSTLCLRLRSENRHTILHRAPDMFLISDCTAAGCTITPLQALGYISEPVNEAFARHDLPLHIDLIDGDRIETLEAEDSAAAADALASMLYKFRTRCAQ